MYLNTHETTSGSITLDVNVAVALNAVSLSQLGLALDAMLALIFTQHKPRNITKGLNYHDTN